MNEGSCDFSRAIEATREDSASYVLQPEFRAEWLGITARSRDYLAQQYRAFGELLEPVTNTLSGWSVLDVGCGDGRWTRRMIEFDARPEDVVGVDVSDLRFEIGRAKNPLVQLVENDGATLPFDNERFDLITQFGCYSHIPTRDLREQVSREIERVTKVGGYFFWWDRPYTDTPEDRNANLDPANYFDWPIRRIEVGQRPKPSETLAPFHGRRVISRLLDSLRHPATHLAALIGPKPK